MDDLDQRISAAIDADFTDDEIKEALGAKPKGHGRGDELFQADPSPSGPIVQRHVGPAVFTSQDQGDEYGRLARDPGALGDIDYSGHTRADETARSVRDDREGHAAGADFARFALGGLTGMGASQVAQGLGAGGRTAGVIGGAVGGAAPAALTPDAQPKDIIGATIMGAALGGAGAPRGKRDVARSQAGRAANAIERVGGEVGIRRPASGGMFDEPGYKDLPEGDPGTMRMAEEARGKIVGGLENRDAASRGELGATEDRVASELGDRKFPTDQVQMRARELRGENNNNPGGTPNDPVLEGRIRHLEKQLGVEEVGPAPAATFGQLRGLQKSLKAEADYGSPSTPENRPARLLEGSAGRAVKDAHPDLPGAYEKYGSEQQKLEDAKNALYGGDGTVRDDDAMTLRNDETARSRLARYGKEGVAAANTSATLDELGAIDPSFRHQLDRLGARNAADVLALQLSMPGGAGIAQGVARTVGHNLGAAGERFFRPATGVGYSGEGPGAAQLQLDPLIQILLEGEHRR